MEAFGDEEAALVEVLGNLADLLFGQHLPAGPAGDDVLDVEDVVQAIELRGDEEGERGEEDLLLGDALGVAHEEIGFSFVLHGRCVDIS